MIQYPQHDAIRTYRLANNKKVALVQDPRYGFWTFRNANGPAPKELDGTWTNVLDLFNAATRYFENKKNPIIEQV